MDDEAIHIADNKQGRTLQSFPVQQELIVCRAQVFMFAFVFPAKKPTLPDICPSLSGPMLCCSFLERETCACWIGLGGLRMLENLAEIEKVLV
jgi:hypothetical protein